MDDIRKGSEDQDAFDAPFNEGTTLTQLGGSASGRDLLDLRRDFAREMQAQVSAIRDVQSVLLRFEAVMETLSSSLTQRNLIEGPMLTATTAIVSGASGTRKSCDEEQKLQAPASPRSKASKAPSYDDEDEVWVPVAPCQPPPRLNLPSLPSVVREENDDAECSRSFLQNVSMGSLSNRGTGRGAAHSASSHSPVTLSHRRQSEPCLMINRHPSLQVPPSRHSSQHSSVPHSRHSKSSGIQSRGIQGMTESIEAHVASRILRPRRDREGDSAFSSRSVSKVSRPLRDENQSAAGQENRSPRKRSESRIAFDQKDLRGRNRRMSMDELRNRHDEVIVRANTLKFGARSSLTPERNPTEGGPTALSFGAWMVLCSAGILDFRHGRFWQMLSWFASAALPLALAAFVVYRANMQGGDHYMPNTMMALTLGSVLSIANLRWAGLKKLLGPADYSLDKFAMESGFMQDWQRVSLRRSFEVLGVLLFMVTCRILSNLFFPSELHYGCAFLLGSFSHILMDLVFLVVACRCAAISFCQLHICSALELSIDSFCLSFFQEMEIEQAIQEWNMVQANLRQVSNQCSGSFFVMAAAIFSTMLLLGEQILRDPSSMQDWRQMALWLGWLYPPTLYFFYVMLRAAAVTEKASRVGPLVNSWNLQEEADTPLGMDLDRQYVVQYINQSQAGFFMKGVRITGFDVQKMLYYFAALTFTLVSRSFSV